MSFLDNPSCGFTCMACPAGSDKPSETRMRTQRYMVAFTKVYLEKDAGYLTWLNGAKAQADVQSGAIAVESKNGF